MTEEPGVPVPVDAYVYEGDRPPVFVRAGGRYFPVNPSARLELREVSSPAAVDGKWPFVRTDTPVVVPPDAPSVSIVIHRGEGKYQYFQTTGDDLGEALRTATSLASGYLEDLAL